MERAENFDGILIETTGLADPGPVIQTFFVDDDLRGRVALDRVVTLVDCLHFLGKVDGLSEEQVAFADLVILNKTDLVSREQLVAVRAKVTELNAQARILETKQSNAALEEVLGRGAFDLDRLLEIEPGLLEEDPEDHEHDETVTSFSFTADAPLDAKLFPPGCARL